MELHRRPRFKLKSGSYFGTIPKGAPLQDAEVSVVRVESNSVNAKTGTTGTAVLQPLRRYVVRVKHVVHQAGQLEGKQFSQSRYYCNLVLDITAKRTDVALGQSVKPTTNKAESPIMLQPVDAQYADLPLGMTSFGATVVNDQVFVIGGKSGRAHSYARSYQNRQVFSLDLNSPDKQWKSVGENLGLQGLAIVGHAGKVYRIGGLEARNQEGEDHDLHSIPDVLAFDPADGTWQAMPSLPSGRSSLDACVADDKIYVVGGWELSGEQSTWATEMLVFDLAQPNSSWQRVPVPFKARALATRHHRDQIVVIGGIAEDGGPTGDVHIFDLPSQTWSAGPQLPTTSDIRGFGCSAVSLGPHLLVSTYDGQVLRLSDDRKQWNRVHQLEIGRFFHQMLPLGDNKFALIGGAHMRHGSQQKVEVYEILSKN